jgi:hypothetical protein
MLNQKEIIERAELSSLKGAARCADRSAEFASAARIIESEFFAQENREEIRAALRCAIDILAKSAKSNSRYSEKLSAQASAFSAALSAQK